MQALCHIIKSMHHLTSDCGIYMYAHIYFWEKVETHIYVDIQFLAYYIIFATSKASGHPQIFHILHGHTCQPTNAVTCRLLVGNHVPRQQQGLWQFAEKLLESGGVVVRRVDRVGNHLVKR